MKKKPFRWLSTGTLLIGGMAWFIHLSTTASACGAATPQLASGSASAQIVHAPTISVTTIAWELTNRQSPLTTADAARISQDSQQYQIDDAFALADWASETQDGREAVPGTDNIGNITAPQGVAAAGHIFAVYPTWQAGIDAWFALIERLYVQGGHASDLVTFALYYVDGLTPQQASPAEVSALQHGYVQNLQTIIASLQTHQGTPAAGSSGSGSSKSASLQLTLASLLPTQPSPGWAGAGALQAAATIPLGTCNRTTGKVPISPLVLAAVQLGAHLEMGVGDRFNHWGAGTPAGVLSQQGVTQCTDFVASAYQLATGKPFPAYPDAGLWWDGTVGHHAGFEQIPAAPGSYPLAGDIIVLRDGAAGHVAIALGVQLPQGNQPGFVIVGQGNATTVVEKWTLDPDGTLKPPWNYWTTVPGYIRIPALTPAVAIGVKPITQADANAGYDSPAQHDLWWDADCSAAVFTELFHAWGLQIRLGQVIDEMSAGGYLSPSQGLLSQQGWPWEASQHGFQASVQSLNYQQLVALVQQGLPVVIGVRYHGGPTTYTAFSVGHFLILTGTTATGFSVVDSSTYQITALSQAAVQSLWTGETVVIQPA